LTCAAHLGGAFFWFHAIFRDWIVPLEMGKQPFSVRRQFLIWSMMSRVYKLWADAGVFSSHSSAIYYIYFSVYF
jgi:hypothetical protein